MDYQTSYANESNCDFNSVTLLGYLDMQTNFLKSHIENELAMACNVQFFETGLNNSLETEGRLVLIDCKHVPIDER